MVVPLLSEIYRLWLPPLLVADPIHHLLVLEPLTKVHKVFWLAFSKVQVKGSPIYWLAVRNVAERLTVEPSRQTGVTYMS